jgi:hypothetical protein
MTHKTPSLVVLGVALVGAWAVAISPPAFFVKAPSARLENPRYQGIALVRDDFDRANFADRGRFVLEKTRPYVDVRIEYPQLAAYLFGFPYLFVSSLEAHMNFFPFLMACALGGIAAVCRLLLDRFGLRPWRVLLLLLPGTLYFTLNRFDAAPTFLVCAALLLLLRGRTTAAHAILAVAVLTKAYPLLYLPLFAMVTFASAGMSGVLRAATAFIGVIAACSLQLALWVGPEWVVSSYLYFGGRMDNSQSLFHHALRAAPRRVDSMLASGFRVLQGALGVAILVFRPRDERALLRWMTAMTIAFVVFSRFQSPQWVVWITPLALVAARNSRELGLVVAQDVLSYAYFPLAYHRFGPTAPSLAFTLGMLTAVRLALLASLLWPSPDERGREVTPIPSAAS